MTELPREQRQPIDLQDSNKWADYWRDQIGVNVIPADTKNKTTWIPWREWQNKAIPQGLHDKWKSEDAFSKGMAIIPGKVWHNQDKSELYLTFIDLDTKYAIDGVCTYNGKETSLQEMAQKKIPKVTELETIHATAEQQEEMERLLKKNNKE